MNVTKICGYHLNLEEYWLQKITSHPPMNNVPPTTDVNVTKIGGLVVNPDELWVRKITSR